MASKSKYQERKNARANGQPPASRSNQPWWITHYTSLAQNPAFGPFFPLRPESEIRRRPEDSLKEMM
jgi:hypothetical protein